MSRRSTRLGTGRNKHFAREGLNWAIGCSDHSESSANKLTATWPNVSHVGPRQGERKRKTRRQKKRVVVVVVGDALRLCFGAVYCYCASVTAGGQACQGRAAFPQRPQSLSSNAQEEIQPQAESEEQTCTLHVHFDALTVTSSQEHPEILTSNQYCITTKFNYDSWH